MTTAAQKPYEITADRIADVVPTFYHSKRVPLFRGRPGIAKTAMVREGANTLSKKLGEYVAVRELHLASMSEVDVRGYLVPYTAGDGSQHSRFTKPEFFAAVEQHPRGILFLDEFPQATHEVQKSVAPLILEGRIGEYILPPGWSVMLAGNGIEDNAGANTLLSHIINRICLVDVIAPDVDSWVLWAMTSNELPPELIAFAKIRPDVVFKSDIPGVADTAYCTPRSLHALGKISLSYPGGVRQMVDEPLGLALMQGTIGVGPAGELAALVRTAINLPSFEDVVAAPGKTAVPSKPDEMYAMIMLCAVRASQQTIDPVVEYMVRFKPNFAITGIISLVKRDRNFASSKLLHKFIMDNQPLFQKFARYITDAI